MQCHKKKTLKKHEFGYTLLPLQILILKLYLHTYTPNNNNSNNVNNTYCDY